MTNQPTGRALAEAAARAMGWMIVPWIGGQGWLRPGGNIPAREPEPTIQDCLAYLNAKPGSVYMEEHPKAHRATFVPHTEPSFHIEGSATTFVDKRDHAEGPTLRDALMRLVVAVAEREAKA